MRRPLSFPPHRVLPLAAVFMLLCCQISLAQSLNLSSEIAFRTCDGSGCHISIVDRQGNVRQIIDEPPEVSGGLYNGVAWSPDGLQLAFATDRPDAFIYKMNADGTNQQPLTGAWGGMPDWSPDGHQIVYATTTDLHLFDLETQVDRQLTFLDGQPAAPRWSPDGTRIAFCDFGDAGGTEIFVVNPDGSGLRQLTETHGDACYPAWSPDGTQIYFLSAQEVPSSIYMMNADGSNVRSLASISVSGGGYLWSMDVSPTGDQLLFTVQNGSGSTLDVMNIDNLMVQVLAATCTDACAPRWRPTGANPAAALNLAVVDESTAAVGADGQALVTLPNGANLSVDAGVTPGSTVALSQVNAAGQALPQPPDGVISDLYEVDAQSWNSALDAVVTLPITGFDPDQADSYRLGYFDEASHQWVAIPSSVDVASGTISATLQHFSLHSIWRSLWHPLSVTVATDPSLYQITYNSGNRGKSINIGDLAITVDPQEQGAKFVNIDLTIGFVSLESETFADMIAFAHNVCTAVQASTSDWLSLLSFQGITDASGQVAGIGQSEALNTFCGGLAPSHSSAEQLLGLTWGWQQVAPEAHRIILPLNRFGLPGLLNELIVHARVTDDAGQTVEKTVDIPVLSENLPAPSTLLSPAVNNDEVCPPRPEFTWNPSTVDDPNTIDRIVVRVVRGWDVWGGSSVSDTTFFNDGSGFNRTMTWTPDRPLPAGEYTWGVAVFLTDYRNVGIRDPRVLKATSYYMFRVDPTMTGSRCVSQQSDAGASQSTPTLTATWTPRPPTATRTPAPTPTDVPYVPCTVSTYSANTVILRVGPGTNRSAVATLPASTDVDVTGLAWIGGELWWQLDKQEAAPQSAASQIWVAASDVESSGDCDSVGQVPTPVIHPIIHPTDTPTPEPAQSQSGSELPPGVEIYFRADQTDLNPGDCTYVRWDVEGIDSVYFQGQGVVGHSEAMECPSSTTTYELEVFLRDGSVDYEYVTLNVGSSSGGGGSDGGGGGSQGDGEVTIYTFEWTFDLSLPSDPGSWSLQSADSGYVCAYVEDRADVPSMEASPIQIGGTTYYLVQQTFISQVGSIQTYLITLVDATEFNRDC